MSQTPTLTLSAARSADLAALPAVGIETLRQSVLAAVGRGGRLAALFAFPGPAGPLDLVAVIAHGGSGALQLARAELPDAYPALSPECPAAHWFERELAEQWGVRPEGHPWLKPIRFHRSSRPGHDAWGRPADAAIEPGVTDYYRLEGEEVHEVAVGPVHAGIIEPGHFRFQCHGEHVYHLEISLGYQHRGVERAAVGGPGPRMIHYMETLAGDTSIGHATAYCELVEALAAVTPPARAQVIRGLALELERLANHTGDLGALAGDVGFLPTASYCGRIRGDFLNMTAVLCGSRFGRGLVRPGGVAFDLDDARRRDLLHRLEAARKDVAGAVNLLWETPSVLSRFQGTGPVRREAAVQLGLVGPAARACGLERDVRQEFPGGIYRLTHVPVAVAEDGDVFGRAFVRWLEIQRSLAFCREQLESLPEGELRRAVGPLPPNRIAIGLVEGWRGEICHVAVTDSAGRFTAYKIVDPSFHNWMGLALALRNQQISDFPLCNKSFNLSYCGHDL